MRQSGIFRAIGVAVARIAQALIGAFFIALGALITYRALQHEPHDNKLIWTGIIVAVLGAAFFPSIFPVFQRIYVLILPNGLPFLNGRRATDPAAPAVKPFDFNGPDKPVNDP